MIAQSMEKGIPVVWKERPFHGAVHKRVLEVAPRMPSVAEIIADIPVSDLPRGFAQYGEARVNGELVPRGCWHLVRPRYAPHCGTVVSLHMPMRASGSSSGGGGGKNILGTVATIAVLLVAAAVSGGLLGPQGLALLGPAFGAGGLGASVAGAGIGIGGRLEVDALRTSI